MRGGWEDIGDANSASSYINVPFGHSSKEVLYKTRLFASLARLPTARRNEGGGLYYYYFFLIYIYIFCWMCLQNVTA